MHLSSEAVRQFKEIYAEEFGEELSDDDAELAALRLLRFCRLLLDSAPGGNSRIPSIEIAGGTHKNEEVR